jgi:hypothetical protein
MQLVFDYDYIKYSFAAVCEKRYIRVVEKQSGNEYEFPTRTDFYGHHSKKSGGWLAKYNAALETPLTPDDFIITDIQEPEPVANALASVKGHIENVKEATGCNSYYGYIGRGDSWRVEASTILKYKGNRKDMLKPILLPEIEDYLIRQHNAEIVRGLESDDKCVIDCYKKHNKKTLIAVEKDFLGCDVVLFNPNIGEYKYCGGFGELHRDAKGKVRGSGRLWYYQQILSADGSDNYAANSASDVKWGEVSAYNLLKGCKNDKEAWEALWEGYKKLYPEKKIVTGWRGNQIEIDALYMLQENATMAHLLRNDSDSLVVTDILDNLKVGYA